MERRRAAGALLALAACIFCTAAAPTASNHTALDIYDGQPEGCYYNFQHYGEGDRIMTNEPCLNCTCHNRMLMCYLRVCPFTKPIGQDCTVEKRADQCCPIVTCPDVPVDLLTLTSTTSPAEYGATGVGKLDKYGCSINGKYFPEGSKVPPSPNKPCEHCYCIRNMTTCVMQECTLHVDGCTPIYHKDVCCPVRYSCDHPEDEIPLLDDKTTTVRPTPGFLLTTTTLAPVTQISQDCVHDDQIFPDGALIKTEKSCEHCYCMKGDIVCVVQDCGTPMENEGKNCTALPPREGQCCPDTYICEGDELNTEYTTEFTTESVIEDITTLSPPRRVGIEGSGYRKEPDNIAYTEPYPTQPDHEGSGDDDEAAQTPDVNDALTTEENKKYIYSTIPSIENTDLVDEDQDYSKKPTGSTDISEDYIKTTTIPLREQEITRDETSELDITEHTTSSIPSYDHKLETSLPEGETSTEEESKYVPEGKPSITTIAPALTEKEATEQSSEEKLITDAIKEKEVTDQFSEEKLVTDATTDQHDKYYTTTLSPILEDEGITTESDREQQTISSESEDHSYVPGLHVASTTSAPFLEEVEETSTSTYVQHFVTDGITADDIHEPSKDKAESIATSAPEVTENLVDANKHEQESTEASLVEHELYASTTDAPHLNAYEKTTKDISEDLTTRKSFEETNDEDKYILTSTSKSILEENEEEFTDKHTENPPSSESFTTTIGLSESDIATQKTQTEKYDLSADEKLHDIPSDISTPASVPIVEDNEILTTKPIEDPAIISSEANPTETSSEDKYEKHTTSAPTHEEHSGSVDKDIHEPEESESETNKPSQDSDKLTTDEIKYDITTEKTASEQQDYESQKPSFSGSSITEDAEITTEFIRDQDYVTNGPIEKESLKPGDYVSSTSSTPFLEEIEKLTTETPHGYVVTDIITEKEDTKPSKQVPTVSETMPFEEDVTTTEPDKGLNTIPSEIVDKVESSDIPTAEKTTQASEISVTDSSEETHDIEKDDFDVSTTTAIKEDKIDSTTEPSSRKEDQHNIESEDAKQPELITEISPTTEASNIKETVPTSSQTLLEETHEIQENISTQDLSTEKPLETQKIPEDAISEHEPVHEADVLLTTETNQNVPEVTTVNLLENEIDEDNLLPPGRIPGEGDCLLNGITYRNETAVPSTNKCHSDCRCVSSIIKCNPIICSPPPEYMDNCQPTYDSPDSCCPSYVCDQFRETLPPMPHIHITTTEIPQQTSIDCRGDQCEIHEDKIEPAVSTELCANKNDCGSKIDKNTDTETSSTSEICVDGKCTSISEDCVAGECMQTPVIDTSAAQCEGETCESMPATLPHTTICENGGKCDEHPAPENTPTSCTGADCKGSEENIIQDCNGETCRRKETSDIEVKPSLCSGQDCEKEVSVETSTSGEISEIKTNIPDIAPTKQTLYETIAPENQEGDTESNNYGSTTFAQPTQSTISATELDSHKEPDYTTAQKVFEKPESASTDKDSVFEPYTELPQTDRDNDVITTKIEEHITETHQISTEVPDSQTQGFETTKPEVDAQTEPSKYTPDVEENTIKIVTDEEIPTKQTVTVSFDETERTSSTPEMLDHDNQSEEKPELFDANEVTAPHVTEAQEHTAIPVSIADMGEFTSPPVNTVPKSEDVTAPSTAGIVQDMTTDYASVPKVTTNTPTNIYETSKETDEKVTESDIDAKDIFTKLQETATEPQTIISEYLTPSSIESSTLGVMLVESGAPNTEDNIKTTDQVTEENITTPEVDKIHKLQEQETATTKLPVTHITEELDSTTELSIKEHKDYPQHVLDINTVDKESTTETQKELDLTSPTIISSEDIPASTLTEQVVTETIPEESDKKEEETSKATPDSKVVSTEPTELLGTTELNQNTEISQETEEELTQTVKPQTHYHEIEPATDISIDQVTLSEKATEYPEILSHKKEQTSESPVIETETETTIESGNTDGLKEEAPTVTVKQETEPEEVSKDSEIKDQTTSAEVPIQTTVKADLVHEEVSTEGVYVDDLEKSTKHEDITTKLPETYETDALFPVKQELTTTTPIEKVTISDMLEMTPVDDKHDIPINVDKVEASTEIITPVHESQYNEPDSEEPEISYTEKTEPEPSDFTTKSYEYGATEKTDTSTSVPEIQETSTEKVLGQDEQMIHPETPVNNETTESTIVETTKENEVTMNIPQSHNVEEDLSTNIQDDVTEMQDLNTEVPEIHSTLSNQVSVSPETQTLITEVIDTSRVADEVTEHQKPITDVDESLATEHPEIKKPVEQGEKQPSVSVTLDTTEIPTTIGGQTEAIKTQATTSEPSQSLATERHEPTLSTPASDVTETESIDLTQPAQDVTTLQESTSIKPAELSTSSTPVDVTVNLLTEEPVKETSQIPDLNKFEQEHKEPEAPETQPTESKPSDESSTTETTQGYELGTELSSKPISDSHDINELPETTASSVQSETTPYLTELKEHTHKIQEQELTTSQIEAESSTEKRLPDTVEIATEPVLDQQTEMKEPTKHFEESSTSPEMHEKTTEVAISKDEESLPTISTEADIKETTEYKDKDVTTTSSVQLTEIDKEASPEKDVTSLETTTSEKPAQSDIPTETQAPEEIGVLATEKTSTVKAEELSTLSPATDKVTKPEEKPITSPTPTPDLSKPGPSNIQPTDELPSPDEDGHFPSSGYGNEPDYVDEDQAFGPGTCRYGGKIYVSAQQIPRDDPCDFCFCFRSDIICLQQSCPPPIHGCHEEPIQGFCCPRYECPVSMATTLNVTTTTTTTTTTLPPHFPTHSYKGAAQRRGCQIKGHTYKVGDVVRGSSGPCLHCTCGGDGQMKCDPKACTPEPMLRQMIAAAVSAKRRR